ncbi:MAG TPA: hypothetical protein VGC22_13435 [Chitinophaga sp.]
MKNGTITLDLDLKICYYIHQRSQFIHAVATGDNQDATTAALERFKTEALAEGFEWSEALEDRFKHVARRYFSEN